MKPRGGVQEVVAGYAGGHKENPTYEEVCTGKTGHFEAVQITYDPAKVSYDRLLEIFWRQMDPTDPTGQGLNRGPQYRSAIFYHDETQKKVAEQSKEQLSCSARHPKPIVTEIIPFKNFYLAEEYHQDYYKKRFLRERLTPQQYHVTQEGGTEKPFENKYWNNKREGIYVDIVSGEPLFSSLDKFDSKTGWPSFTKPLVSENIEGKEDRSLFRVRTEVRSKEGHSHLGHLFPDGPAPTGFRYCINSAALRFIPKEDLEKEGYGRFKKLFKK